MLHCDSKRSIAGTSQRSAWLWSDTHRGRLLQLGVDTGCVSRTSGTTTSALFKLGGVARSPAGGCGNGSRQRTAFKSLGPTTAVSPLSKRRWPSASICRSSRGGTKRCESSRFMKTRWWRARKYTVDMLGGPDWKNCIGGHRRYRHSGTRPLPEPKWQTCISRLAGSRKSRGSSSSTSAIAAWRARRRRSGLDGYVIAPAAAKSSTTHLPGLSSASTVPIGAEITFGRAQQQL
mmetsp:Transcript_71331/g.152456  ORF Transcript_71331/g.152456 Transcript_71331/m.152456 type:complete len:233 (+) Transcript_71331:146-844(+)